VRSRPAQTSEPFVVFLGGVAAFGPAGPVPNLPLTKGEVFFAALSLLLAL
jgi:hypothetical protein